MNVIELDRKQLLEISGGDIYPENEYAHQAGYAIGWTLAGIVVIAAATLETAAKILGPTP